MDRERVGTPDHEQGEPRTAARRALAAQLEDWATRSKSDAAFLRGCAAAVRDGRVRDDDLFPVGWDRWPDGLDRYVDLAVHYDNLGFLSPSGGRWRPSNAPGYAKFLRSLFLLSLVIMVPGSEPRARQRFEEPK